MYKKVSTDMNFAQREKDVSAFWKENDIVKKSFKLREGAPRFTFYDGPPTANGRPHIGHIITRAMKDLIPRYHTMKGENVLRVAGWDTHGLPVELEVEKKLGINGKPQIEKYGIEPFIKECKKSVWVYLNEWEEMSERVAYWLDMENPYVTYHDSYIESVWWSLKQIADKGLLYKGHKVVPFCPRCGTALSSHEVAQGYKEVSEFSAFVRFKAKGMDNTFLLAWTTTPWTLPSNVALCVNADEDYAFFNFKGQTLIMARALLKTVLGEEYNEIEILKTVKGKELVGLKYEPLYKTDKTVSGSIGKAYRVVSDGYVSLTDGTGIVHIAPAFGEDDARIGREWKLPFVQLVNTQGEFIEGTPWEGVFVKDADPLIFEDLKQRRLLFKKEMYTHNYPHCWRCDTPLIYYARGGWFIAMTKVRDELVKNNRSVNWYPSNIKEGRMGNFVENVIDWALSRERYWGTPLPVWVCRDCGKIHVIGSRKELQEMAIGEIDLPELHRPWIDRVKLKCPECGGVMDREKEVIDCWYDSGSMPFAQWHYPFENKEKFEENFPADFISEAVDQTRGWFYSLLAISTCVFKRAPYENCLVLGHVQDKDGRKMSKHLGNVVNPWDVLDKYGADAVRWYFYTAGAPWLPSRFYEEAVLEGQRKYISTLWNTYAFYILYADIDNFVPSERPLKKESLTLMDRWILSRLNETIQAVDSGLAGLKIPESAAALQKLADDLSNWYVRRCRARFWGKDMTEDKAAAYATLYTVLYNMCLLSAPFTPFMAESMYQNMVRSVNKNAPESVHLCDFPKADQSLIDKDMTKQMADLIEVVQLGRACRNLASLKVRQPLSEMLVRGAEFSSEYAELAKDELNVKEISFVNDASAFTDYNIKPQLKTLGPRFGKELKQAREALQNVDGVKAVKDFDEGLPLVINVNGREEKLSRDDVLIEPKQKEGLVSQEEGGVAVALVTKLSDELISEGIARELISKLQTMRKDAGFNVVDRINVYYAGENEIIKAFEQYSDMISSVVLAKEMLKSEAPEGAYTADWDINGHKAKLAVKVSGK